MASIKAKPSGSLSVLEKAQLLLKNNKKNAPSSLNSVTTSKYKVPLKHDDNITLKPWQKPSLDAALSQLSVSDSNQESDDSDLKEYLKNAQKKMQPSQKKKEKEAMSSIQPSPATSKYLKPKQDIQTEPKIAQNSVAPKSSSGIKAKQPLAKDKESMPTESTPKPEGSDTSSIGSDFNAFINSGIPKRSRTTVSKPGTLLASALEAMKSSSDKANESKQILESSTDVAGALRQTSGAVPMTPLVDANRNSNVSATYPMLSSSFKEHKMEHTMPSDVISDSSPIGREPRVLSSPTLLRPPLGYEPEKTVLKPSSTTELKKTDTPAAFAAVPKVSQTIPLTQPLAPTEPSSHSVAEEISESSIAMAIEENDSNTAERTDNQVSPASISSTTKPAQLLGVSLQSAQQAKVPTVKSVSTVSYSSSFAEESNHVPLAVQTIPTENINAALHSDRITVQLGVEKRKSLSGSDLRKEKVAESPLSQPHSPYYSSSFDTATASSTRDKCDSRVTRPTTQVDAWSEKKKVEATGYSKRKERKRYRNQATQTDEVYHKRRSRKSHTRRHAPIIIYPPFWNGGGHVPFSTNNTQQRGCCHCPCASNSQRQKQSSNVPLDDPQPHVQPHEKGDFGVGNPLTLAMNGIVKSQLNMLEKFLMSSRRFVDEEEDIARRAYFSHPSDNRPVTLENTLEYIRKHRPKAPSFEQALKDIDRDN
jgi:hypothetical protein